MESNWSTAHAVGEQIKRCGNVYVVCLVVFPNVFLCQGRYVVESAHLSHAFPLRAQAGEAMEAMFPFSNEIKS